MSLTCPVCARTHDAMASPAQSPYCSNACYHHVEPLPPHPTPPSCLDGVTITCPVCQHSFAPTGRQRYCSRACRAAAYRRRRDAARPALSLPKSQPRRPVTVYECPDCGARALGGQRCDTCQTFMRRVGIGGECPSCSEPVAVTELLGEEVIASR